MKSVCLLKSLMVAECRIDEFHKFISEKSVEGYEIIYERRYNRQLLQTFVLVHALMNVLHFSSINHYINIWVMYRRKENRNWK